MLKIQAGIKYMEEDYVNAKVFIIRLIYYILRFI